MKPHVEYREIPAHWEAIKDRVKDKVTKRTSWEDNRRVYEMETEDGTATMVSYTVFDGVELMYQDVTMGEVHHTATPLQGLFEFHFVRDGRVECEFENGKVLYMDEGDISVGWKNSESYRHRTRFPLHHFKGLALAIYVPKAEASLKAFLGLENLDLQRICEDFCEETEFSLFSRSDLRMRALFESFYDVPEEIHESYLKLKCAEIIMLLSTMKGRSEVAKHFYDVVQVDTIKLIHQHLMDHLDEKVTIEEMARTYGMAPTTLKKCFKGVYGMSVYQYVKCRRMEEASRLLVETDETILTIANGVSYENASKFSEAFRAVIGEKPSEFRKKRRMSFWSN